MKGVIDEIVLNFQERLKEFNRHQYDVNSIKIDLDGLGMDDIHESQSGRFIRRAGVAVGGVAAAALVASNWWNPAGWFVAAGWIATGVGSVTKIAAEQINEQEKREFQKQREDLKLSLFKKVEKKEQETINVYKKWLNENLASPVRKEIIDELSTYIKGLSGITDALVQSALELQCLKLHIEKDLSNWN